MIAGIGFFLVKEALNTYRLLLYMNPE